MDNVSTGCTGPSGVAGCGLVASLSTRCAAGAGRRHPPEAPAQVRIVAMPSSNPARSPRSRHRTASTSSGAQATAGGSASVNSVQPCPAPAPRDGVHLSTRPRRSTSRTSTGPASPTCHVAHAETVVPATAALRFATVHYGRGSQGPNDPPRPGVQRPLWAPWSHADGRSAQGSKWTPGASGAIPVGHLGPSSPRARAQRGRRGHPGPCRERGHP